MSNLVIVAIPDENDRVWKISSEKVPHLTLLFLGEMDQVANSQKIIDFVEHAANTSLSRFYLPVDRRGELGDDPQKGPADVLFFKKTRYDFKAVRDFRAALLQDNNIKTAYDAAEQFEGPWTPHLTLGYQTTPAKEDKEDFPFYDVSFNKIAVWTGDFEGPEFLLKDYWDEFDTLEAMPMDVAMSSINQERAKLGLDRLEHHGVKGMKWGVRKPKDTTVTTARGKTKQVTAKKAARMDRNFQARAHTLDTLIQINNKAATAYNSSDLKRINDKPEYKNADFTKPSSLRDKYYKEHADAFAKHVETAAKSIKSPTGKFQYDVHIHDNGNWEVISREVQHAAGDTSLIVKVTFDADGFITGIEPVESTDTIAQTAMYGEAFVDGLVDGLEHHGIKGMRWGHRKAEPTAVAPTAASRVPHGEARKTKIEVSGGQNHPAHEDAIKVAEARAKLAKSGPSALSNKELRDVATRIQLEQQVRTLTRSSGHKFVRNLLGQQGKEAANQAVRQQVKKRASFA